MKLNVLATINVEIHMITDLSSRREVLSSPEERVVMAVYASNARMPGELVYHMTSAKWVREFQHGASRNLRG